MAEENGEISNAREEMKTRRKKSLFKSIIVVGALLVFGTACYAGLSFYIKEKKKVAQARSEPKRRGVSINYLLEPFIVNLMNKAAFGKRYLKAQIVLEVGGEDGKRKIEGHKPELRDTILLLLSSYSFNEINTIDGKLELKQALLYRLNQILDEPIVHRIYFTEFVVQ